LDNTKEFLLYHTRANNAVQVAVLAQQQILVQIVQVAIKLMGSLDA